MVYIIVFLAFVSLGSAHKRQVLNMAPDKATALLQQVLVCARETGMEPQLIMQVKNKNYTMDDTVKKFLFCAFQNCHLSSEDGIIQVDKLLEMYPEKADKVALREAAEECNQSDESDPLQRIGHFFMCFQNKTPVTLKIFGN